MGASVALGSLDSGLIAQARPWWTHSTIVGIDACTDIETNRYPLATDDDRTETVCLVEALDGRVVAERRVLDAPYIRENTLALDRSSGGWEERAIAPPF